MRFNNFWSYRRIISSSEFWRTLWHSRRNVLADKHGLTPPAGPYMAELDITYRCNCRCRMCQRWRDPRPDSLDMSDYVRLAAEFKDMAVHQISIAGGEPLTRPDVFEIINAFARQGLSVNLCTNGLLLEKLRGPIIASGATCITVSLDGADARSHDDIRGATGSFAQIERGIRAFLGSAARRRPVLRVRMTVSSLNQHEVGAFYRRWRHVADDVLLQPVHLCGDAFYTGMPDSDLTLDPSVLRMQISGTPLESDGYMRALLDSLDATRNFPQRACYAGILMARIDPWGNVYPCLEQHVRVGNVRDRTFESIWRSAAFEAERRRLRNGRPCRCWYNNTALIGYYGDLLLRTGLEFHASHLKSKR